MVPPSTTPTLRLSIDYFSLRIPTPGVHTPATVHPVTPRLPSLPATSPASSGPSLSSSKASWSSILIPAGYRSLLGGSDSSSPNSRRTPSEPSKPTLMDPLSGSSPVSSGFAAEAALIRRRRSAAIPTTAPSIPEASIHKSRADSFPVRINTTPGAQGYRRRQPSMNQHVPSKKIIPRPASVTVALQTPQVTEPPYVSILRVPFLILTMM